MDGKKTHRVDGLSKLTKISELRQHLIEVFDAPSDQQRLFYRGKQVRIFLCFFMHLPYSNKWIAAKSA